MAVSAWTLHVLVEGVHQEKALRREPPHQGRQPVAVPVLELEPKVLRGAPDGYQSIQRCQGRHSRI